MVSTAPWGPTVLHDDRSNATPRMGRMSGRGGRNTASLLALALALEGWGQVVLIAADTDGLVRSAENARAVCTLTTRHRPATTPADALSRHLRRGGDLVVTGPTHTNVNDFRATLILPRH